MSGSGKGQASKRTGKIKVLSLDKKKKKDRHCLNRPHKQVIFKREKNKEGVFFFFFQSFIASGF